MKFLTLPRIKKKREEQKHIPTSKALFLRLQKMFLLVTLVTNNHKLSILPLVVRT